MPKKTFFVGDADYLDDKQIRNIRLWILKSVAVGLRQRFSEFKMEENRMPPVNSFNDLSPLADSTGNISWFDRIAGLFV